LKNTSQLMLSTRNADLNSMAGNVSDQRLQSGAFQKTYAHCEFYRRPKGDVERMRENRLRF
jgi:hypothetical protein